MPQIEEVDIHKDEIKIAEGVDDGCAVDDDGKIELPAYPCPIFEIEDEKIEHLQYKGDMEDLNARMRHKLLVFWFSWSRYRNDQRLFDLIREPCDDKESDKFFLLNTIVNILDMMGRTLSLTNIVEEVLPKDADDTASTEDHAVDEKVDADA